jgi:SAM-dependent methyltransferase
VLDPGASPPLGERLSEKELCPDDLLAGQEAAFARDVERLHRRRHEFVRVCCPACGGTSSKIKFEKFGFSFQSCVTCLTLYMSPRPSPDVMADYYAHSENYAYWAKYIFPASEATRREKIHKPWLERVIDACERFSVRRRTLFEVGPGFGTFAALAIASKAFERVVAIEPTPELATACRARGVKVIERRIEEIVDELETADVLVSFEVIEHLFAPKKFFDRCAALLVPGGLLVLSCPNGLGFDIELLGADALAVDAEHVNLFNPDSLSRLLEDSGFGVLDVSTPGRLDVELVRDAVLRGKFDPSKDPFLRRVLVDDWERLGWPFQEFLASHRLSSHMWVVARRR